MRLLRDIKISGSYTFDNWTPIYELEEIILEKFGLPPSFEISSTIQEAVPDDPDLVLAAEKFLGWLAGYASEYLMRQPETDRSILEKGKREKQPFDNVLPYMNLSTQSYSVFIYEELFCTDRISIDCALAVLNRFRQLEGQITSLISFDDPYNIKIDFSVYRELHGANIPYLEEYLQHQIDIRARNEADIQDWHRLFTKGRKLPGVLTISHFHILKIECHEYDEDCFLNIIFSRKKDRWYGVVVSCSLSQLESLLNHSRFNEQASLVRANLSNQVRQIDLYQDYSMRQLEITGIPIHLKVTSDSYPSTGNPGFYLLNAIGNELDQEDATQQLPF